MTDQPALGPDGRLRDASEIDWYNDPDDNDLIQPTSVKQLGQHSTLTRSRPVRAMTGTRLAEAIAAEKLDEFGKPLQSYHRRLIQPIKHNSKPSVKCKRTTGGGDETDAEDQTYTSTVEDGLDDDEDDDDVSEVIEISNEEIADMLPSKTIPELSRKGHTRTQKAKGKMPAAALKKKARTHSTDGSKVDDRDGPFPNIMRDASIFSTDSSTTHAKTVTGLWDGFVPWTGISWATGHCVCIFCVLEGVPAMRPLLVP
ncbi:hypothetical protein BGY98DRAFT_1104443 [Russula aff. rugulosa BPL654]|nr:hypothetical protein BGY98DRAFT_1104443 [Russula aff. rugulosa BPL654]